MGADVGELEAVGAPATGATGMASQPSTVVASPVKPSGHVHSEPFVPLTQIEFGNKQVVRSAEQ